MAKIDLLPNSGHFLSVLMLFSSIFFFFKSRTTIKHFHTSRGIFSFCLVHLQRKKITGCGRYSRLSLSYLSQPPSGEPPHVAERERLTWHSPDSYAALGSGVIWVLSILPSCKNWIWTRDKQQRPWFCWCGSNTLEQTILVVVLTHRSQLRQMGLEITIWQQLPELTWAEIMVF